MLRMRVRPFILNILCLFFTLYGCVGTIQENSAPQNLEYKNPPTTFNFPGIVSARGISHDKVELEFFPAPGGIEAVKYDLFVNNSTFPIAIDTKALLALSGGQYLYTVKNLQPDREYKFQIKAAHLTNGSISKNESEAYARTFDNLVSDFNGVSKLSLVPGDTDGSVLVDWIAAPMIGFPIAGPFDPVNYEVTVISEIGGVGNLNNPTYRGTDKKVILVPTPPAKANPLSNPSFISIDGLAADTRYYFQVRAINTLYSDYSSNPDVTVIPVNREMNTRYMNIKTAKAGTLFDFRQDNVILSNATGLDAFDKIDVFWKPGSGSFTGYRIFFAKYTGNASPSEDDQLNEESLLNLNSSNNFLSISPSLTTKRISGLENQAWYQVKVALCKIPSCPVNSTDVNAAIISDLKAIQVKPTLAPFGGINNIEPPGQYSEKDVVKLKFDAPLLSQGFANSMEFYCVDPADKSRMFKFDGTNQIAGSGTPRCEGLYLSGAAQPVAGWKSQIIKGLIPDGTREYCFASSPLITGFGEDVRLSPASRIIRCSFPEVKPPTITQFPGIAGGCQVSGNSATVNWALPTGGIYSGFKVFWREKSTAALFSFPAAIGDVSNLTYSASPNLNAESLNYNLTNLMPGQTYQIGVLAQLDLDPPAVDQFSEFNLKVIDCMVPLPVASFKGFSRIFAIGPKVDGRIPNEPVNKSFSDQSYLYEAINSDGIPFEVAMSTATAPNLTENYVDPPGWDMGNSFSSPFDGAPGAEGNAFSKSGIISLAWEEVPMMYRNGTNLEVFTEADQLFNTNQPANNITRTNRKWGYKIYRSSDNKMSWQELTTTHGLVYSSNFTQLKKPNDGSASSRRMAFFTDYSVKSLSEFHEEASGKDIERARTYYYKIVPIFNGKNLNYATSSDHIVRVTLPPANVALVHRWMANRAHCLEIDKVPQISSHYSCDYNGIGSKPKGIPYRVGQTKIDQGGDLLIDRQELGCRYTRGDRVDDPTVGVSIFNLLTRRDANDKNHFPLFKGFRTIQNNEDPQSVFKGCTGATSATLGLSSNNYANGVSANYNRFLVGDCIGGHNESISPSSCSPLQYTNNEFTRFNISTPGVSSAPSFDNPLPPDCSNSTPNAPTTLTDKLLGRYASNVLMQSEFMAIFYNTYSPALSSTSYNVPIEGPSALGINQSQIISPNLDSGMYTSQCFINLASIDGSGYMKPRWFSLNDLAGGKINFKGSNQILLDKTVNEVTEVATTGPLTLFNGHAGDGTSAEFKLPASNLRTSSRYRDSSRLAKIITSNASKIPPVGRLNPAYADTLCQNYFVQVGVASDNGNFLPDSQVQPKRTLRHAESVTASLWPDHFDVTDISDLENTSNTGSCNTGNKNVPPDPVNRGSLMSNRISLYNPDLLDVPLVTGSSSVNGPNSSLNTHSQKCISRFGIQDIVGNLKESNSDQIFCDYSQDEIRLGPVSQAWNGGQTIINSDKLPDQSEPIVPYYPFFNTNQQRDHSAVLHSDGAQNKFEFRYRDGSQSRFQDVKPWVKISVNSGYCSTVDSNPDKRTGDADPFKDLATGFWTPIKLANGSVNPAIIEKTQPDQMAINEWRNGDGRFLDFGPQSISPALNRGQTLDLRSTALGTGKYFNPLIGLPLRCSSGSCNDSQLSQPNDNTSTTTTILNANVDPSSDVNDIPLLTNFPIGNSQITNPGISDFQFPASGFSEIKKPDSGGVSQNPFTDILVAVLFDDPTTHLNPTPIMKTFSDYAPGETIRYYRVIWDVPRQTIFRMNHGGSFSNNLSGRYTTSFTYQIPNTTFQGYGTNNLDSGTRCTALINQEP